MLATRPRRFTADEFLAEYEGVPGKWELVDGEIRMMAGGSIRHAAVARNILTALTLKLRGSGCAPYGSDAGLRSNDHDVRYPDVGVYCDPRDRDRDARAAKAFEHPSVLFEVLSPSTARYDREQKIVAYQDVSSVRLIVLVDPDREQFETYERIEEGWKVGHHLPGATLAVLDPAFEITADEMFAED